MCTRFVLAGILCGALAACGGGDDDGDDGDGPNTFTGSAVVNVTYSGGLTGRFILSLGTLAAPVCPTDVPTAFTMMATPSFPLSHTFEALPAGSYHAFGFLDVNSDAGTVPCPALDDVCGRTMPATPIDADHPSATFNLALDIAGCQYP
jgi:hypothetical protein